MMPNKNLTEDELDKLLHPVLDNPYKLVWKDGSFEQESINIIKEIESKNPGFSKTLYDIATTFKFHYNENIGYVDCHSQFKDVKGVDVDVHIIITEEKIDKDKILVERLQQFKKSFERRNPEISELIGYYLENRDEYKEKYPGKYIKLTIGDNIEIYDHCVGNNRDQIGFRIGHEFHIPRKPRFC